VADAFTVNIMIIPRALRRPFCLFITVRIQPKLMVP
jgi:hypothetical protein